MCVQVKCSWGLSDQQESLLTVWVFIGLLIGAYVWGAAADIGGRKLSLFSATIGGILTSSLAAVMPNIGVSFCRGERAGPLLQSRKADKVTEYEI